MMIDVAANCRDAITISARSIPKPAQEFRAFGRQSKRDRDHCVICCDIVLASNRESTWAIVASPFSRERAG